MESRELKEILQGVSGLKSSLEGLTGQLRYLALVQMAQERYTPEQRKQFYASWDELEKACEAARKHVTDYRKEDGRSWEDVERIESRERVAEIQRETSARMRASQEAWAALTELEKSAPILAAMIRAESRIVSPA